DGLASHDMVAQFHADFGAQRQINVRAGAELDEANPIPARDRLALLHKRHDPAGNYPRDQAHPDLLPRGVARFKTNQDILIVRGRFSFERIEELTETVLEETNLPAYRGVLHMHVEHRQKY